MEIIDISWPISPEMTTYKDKQQVSFTHTKLFERDQVREQSITVSTHTGTHVDASAHFLQQGVTIDRMPLEQLIGPCKVVDLTHIQEVIRADDLQEYEFEEGDFVLLKTRNSEVSATAKFDQNFVYLDASAASYFVELGVDLVGIDYLGIERNQPSHDTHTILMKAGVAIVEGLRLAHVEQDEYFFVCLPLALIGTEAAPARAILVSGL